MMTFRFDQTHIYRIWNRVKFNRNYSRLNIPMIVIFSITGNDILQERKTAAKRNLLSLDMGLIGLQCFATNYICFGTL
jgi:hypothetical protein